MWSPNGRLCLWWGLLIRNNLALVAHLRYSPTLTKGGFEPVNDTMMNHNAGAGHDASGKSERVVSLVPLIPPLPKRKRVAAYARVSMEKDAMLHSLAAQVSYYKGLIQRKPEWEYAGVYADEGLTGTKENRPEFQRLLADCRAGKIDMVIVKSISRLARNTVTMLATVRELKGLGIDVLFEKENIHSMSGDGELMLSILASFAQEESLSVSENCKWRIRKNFAAGDGNSFLMYGYRIRGGAYEIVPEEAEIVPQIYEWYLNGTGTGRIAIMLNAMQVPPCRGTVWNRTTIMSILRNEKYTGNLLLQKTFISDHLTKAKKKNRGELPQYYVEASHEAIIDQSTFDKVQEELKRRAELYETSNSVVKDRNPLAQKITCGLCGKHFIRKFANSKSKYKAPIWVCQTYLAKTKAACPSRRISEKVLLPILAGVLGLQEEEDVLKESSRIEEITVFPDGLLMVSADGETIERHWENPSRALSWTDEMKQEAKRKERDRQECLKQQYTKVE